MNAILRFLFPAAPSGAGASWLLLAARIVFGVLLMTHGIAKWQNFETLSATFPDPLGVGSRHRSRWRSSARSSARWASSPERSTGWRCCR